MPLFLPGLKHGKNPWARNQLIQTCLDRFYTEFGWPRSSSIYVYQSDLFILLFKARQLTSEGTAEVEI